MSFYQENRSMSEPLKVACAVIRDRKRLLIAQRNPGAHLGGYWEFPGGKLKPGETHQQCLVREADEELGICISPVELLAEAKHPYPDKDVYLYFYLCDYLYGTPVKHACHDFKWIVPEDFHRYQFPPADADFIAELLRRKNELFR